jgi:hypothetical protein
MNIGVFTPILFGELLLLMLAANGAPILAARVFGPRWAAPVDHGLALADGRPLFGPSKTWRGLAAGLLGAMLAALVLGHDLGFGLTFGGASLAGDLLSSFVKRRLGIPSSGRAIGIDQIPEALLPLLACQGELQLGWLSIVLLVALFVVGALLLSRVMYRLGIRPQPY